MNVGFIGLGIMGQPMALNLVKGGHTLAVYGRRAETVQPLEANGATACGSPRDVAAKSEITIVMVSDTPDVEQVILGENGVIHGARPGSVVVDMSTISPSATRAMAKKLAEKGIEMVDAPVSGGDIGAIQGTLSIMVGGKPEVFERVKPVLECVGKTIVHIGPNGAGQVAKACNQIVAGVTIQAVAEALTLARASGVDAGKVRDALLGGFAYSRILEVHGKRMLDRVYKPGFKAKLHQKDMAIVLREAHQLGLALPAAALVAQQFNAMVGAGEAELDNSGIIRVLERAAGRGMVEA
ncbi:MAG: 2-hydroxy-3-oxopropionate reductase [Betaproteobacteria bacterium]|nr:2-hydroxy-3-oxopropionate reductase [Betaproteobacteria bacterium]